MELIILIVSQMIFSFTRTLNVRYTAKDMIFMGILTSTFVKLSWLISASIGVNSIIDKDWTTAIVYIISGLIGDYLSFKIKIK